MAADPTPENADQTAAPAEGKGGRGKLMVLAAVLVAAGLGASVAYSQFGLMDRMVNAPEDASETPSPTEYGEFIQLEPLVVNPSETGGARFLMVSVALESAEPDVLEEVTLKDVVVRDAVNRALSEKTVGTLADVSNRDIIKEEIRTLINSLLAEGTIDRLYFTQFMLQ